MMRTRLFRLGAVVVGALFASCTSTPPEAVDPAAETVSAQAATVDSPYSVPDLTPRDGQPLFLGVSNRLRNRDDEVAAAVTHAAEQASRYLRIAARYQLVSQRGSEGIGYLENIDAQWDADLASRIAESVEVRDVRQIAEGTLVVVSFPELPGAPQILPGTINATGGGAPGWVRTTPEVPRHLVGVGTTQRSRTLRDTIDGADEEALKAVLLQAGSTVRMVEDRRSMERRGTTGTVTADETAEAVLTGFAVVARYVSPDGRYHYSLAIAREE
jgi:hypothetical protein